MRGLVLALAFVSAALLIGIFDAQIFRARAERIQREKDDLNRMAQIVEADANNIFSRLKFFFQAADLWLANHPSADPRFDPSFRELVDAFRSSLDNRVDIRLVSESGGLFYIPSKDSKPLADVSDRAYYKAQMDPATRGLFVADPVKSRVTQLWGIPISYPLASRNGGIAVIFAAIEEPTILELYEAVRPKPGGSITLLRKDGIILARAPFDEALIGKPISPDLAAWRRAMQDSPSGSFESRVATTDNSVRLVAYKADLEDGFVVSVSAKKDDVLAEWNAAAIWQGVILVLVLALGAFLFTRLFGALHRLDEVHAELRRNLERARRSDATKDKLFSVIAHDLRGPIGGMASLLDGMEIDRRSISDEEMGRFISVLRDTSWNTSQLLENLLAWSRDQRSEMAFRPERLYLLPLVRECEEIFSLSASGKGVAIELGIPAELEAYADPDQLRILVRNLLSNAVKFTPRGKKVLASASGVEGGIEIVVRDEGIGMDEEQRRALFDLSATRSRSGTENERGSGLGLVLCKSIVDRHGGRIEVESEPGSGSAFTVFLPAGKEE